MAAKKTAAKKTAAKKTAAKLAPPPAKKRGGRQTGVAAFPRHSLMRALRIPKAILEQNAGKPCTEEKACAFAGVALSGPAKSEIASALKYGLLERSGDQLSVTDTTKQIVRPNTPTAALDAKRAAVQKAPGISEVYSHYRGENLPDPQFLRNTLIDTFGMPEENVSEFIDVFLETLADAELIEEKDGAKRLIDATVASGGASVDNAPLLAKLGKKAAVSATDTCFVMMPFAPPIGTYYAKIYEPAIKKAGLTPVRADADIFGTGKIIDQIWRGINDAKILLADLTSKNPNVFYELGLAHALNKPVVLVAGKHEDVPFDLRHIRVIYYELDDPFWGQKLLDKVAENILSALANPEEALFKTILNEVK